MKPVAPNASLVSEEAGPDREADGIGLLILAILAIHLLLVSPDLMPTYIGINAFDEAKYVESGRLLLAGELRNLSWGPIVAFVYAPLHLIFGRSPNWFLLEARAGQFILFTGLWLSTYYLAIQLRKHLNRYVVLGVLFVSTGFFDVLDNPSDAVFASFSALALAKLLQYRQKGNIRDVLLASTFVALAVLARLEGALLLPVLLLTVLFYRHNHGWARVAAASLLPVGLLLGGYLLIASEGSFVTASSKAYTAFQANQPIPGGARVEERTARAQDLFGTPEENNSSVLRAALRNPQAFANRIFLSALRIPEFYLQAFNRRLGPALLLLSLMGVYTLLRRREFGLVTIFVLWSLQPMVSLMFLPLHLVRQLIYLPHVLTAVGATAMAAKKVSRFDTWLPLGLAIALGAYALIDNKLAFLVTAVVIAAPLLLHHILSRKDRAVPGMDGLLLMLFLAAGLILRGPYSFPNYPPIGETEHERVVHYLQEELPANSRILEGLPLPAVAAKLTDIHPSNVPSDVATPEALHGWLVRREIKAIFVGDHVGIGEKLTRLLEDGQSTYFEQGYATENGRQAVYLVKNSR